MQQANINNTTVVNILKDIRMVTTLISLGLLLLFSYSLHTKDLCTYS